MKLIFNIKYVINLQKKITPNILIGHTYRLSIVSFHSFVFMLELIITIFWMI